MLESAKQAVVIHDAQRSAYVAAATQVEDITKHVDAALNAGTLSPEAAAATKSYLVRGVLHLRQAATTSAQQGDMAKGKIAALSDAVEVLKRRFDGYAAIEAEIAAETAAAAVAADSEPVVAPPERKKRRGRNT